VKILCRLPRHDIYCLPGSPMEVTVDRTGNWVRKTVVLSTTTVSLYTYSVIVKAIRIKIETQENDSRRNKKIVE
jgi:hypothetical protein